jgi:hypothetical protein
MGKDNTKQVDMAKKHSLLIVALTSIAMSPFLAQADASYLLQLGSMPSEAAAEEKWNALQSDHSAELGDLEKRITAVDIGGNRSIYRLQAGPVNNRELATERCNALKADKQDCYLVETAVLSHETPTQALRAVRANDSEVGELQLGSDGSESAGMISLDSALPRASKETAKAQVESAKQQASEELESAKAELTPDIVLPDHIPDSPLGDSLEADRMAEATSTVPPLPAADKDSTAPTVVAATGAAAAAIAAANSADDDVQQAQTALDDKITALKAPERIRFEDAPTIVHATEQKQAAKETLQSLAERPEAPIARVVKAQAPEADVIASANSPMGSLGTLRLNNQGQVVGASAATTTAAIAPAPAPSAPQATAIAAAPASINPAPVNIAPSPARPAMPNSIALMAPPSDAIVNRGAAPARIAQPAAPQLVDRWSAPATTAPAPSNTALAAPITTFPHNADTLNRLTPSKADDVRVEVREAIRVKEQDAPVQPIAADPRYGAAAAIAAPAPLYTAPEAWRGTPGSTQPKGAIWAQFGQFVHEDAAFAYFDELRASRPDLTNGVRVRALRPYSAVGLGRHVALRVGPYRSEADVNALCAQMKASRIPCTSIQEMGLSTLRGPRQAELALDRPTPAGAAPAANPFAAPGKYWVQVGSYASPAEAYNRYSALKAQYPDLFVSVQPNVSSPKASSSSNAVHRLRIGGFIEETAAQGFCNSLGRNGVSCLIIKQ